MLEVDRRFDAEGEGFPLDVTWLDIEYAAEHRYFDWDESKFPDVKGMLKQIEDKGRKVVAIVDPHIKRSEDFYVYKEALEKNVLIKNTDGHSDYEGWCWTGSSAWVDFFNERSWDWWNGMFKFEKWTVRSRCASFSLRSCLTFSINLFTMPELGQKSVYLERHERCALLGGYSFGRCSDFLWFLCFLEPSVFNGPEITLPKDSLYEDGKWENRDMYVDDVLFGWL